MLCLHAGVCERLKARVHWLQAMVGAVSISNAKTVDVEKHLRVAEPAPGEKRALNRANIKALVRRPLARDAAQAA
jgi:hypothetical protein